MLTVVMNPSQLLQGDDWIPTQGLPNSALAMTRGLGQLPGQSSPFLPPLSFYTPSFAPPPGLSASPYHAHVTPSGGPPPMGSALLSGSQPAAAAAAAAATASAAPVWDGAVAAAAVGGSRLVPLVGVGAMTPLPAASTADAPQGAPAGVASAAAAPHQAVLPPQMSGMPVSHDSAPPAATDATAPARLVAAAVLARAAPPARRGSKRKPPPSPATRRTLRTPRSPPTPQAAAARVAAAAETRRLTAIRRQDPNTARARVQSELTAAAVAAAGDSSTASSGELLSEAIRALRGLRPPPAGGPSSCPCAPFALQAAAATAAVVEAWAAERSSISSNFSLLCNALGVILADGGTNRADMTQLLSQSSSTVLGVQEVAAASSALVHNAEASGRHAAPGGSPDAPSLQPASGMPGVPRTTNDHTPQEAPWSIPMQVSFASFFPSCFGWGRRRESGQGVQCAARFPQLDSDAAARSLLHCFRFPVGCCFSLPQDALVSLYKDGLFKGSGRSSAFPTTEDNDAVITTLLATEFNEPPEVAAKRLDSPILTKNDSGGLTPNKVRRFVKRKIVRFHTAMRKIALAAFIERAGVLLKIGTRRQVGTRPDVTHFTPSEAFQCLSGHWMVKDLDGHDALNTAVEATYKAMGYQSSLVVSATEGVVAHNALRLAAVARIATEVYCGLLSIARFPRPDVKGGNADEASHKVWAVLLKLLDGAMPKDKKPRKGMALTDGDDPMRAAVNDLSDQRLALMKETMDNVANSVTASLPLLQLPPSSCGDGHSDGSDEVAAVTTSGHGTVYSAPVDGGDVANLDPSQLLRMVAGFMRGGRHA